MHRSYVPWSLIAVIVAGYCVVACGCDSATGTSFLATKGRVMDDKGPIAGAKVVFIPVRSKDDQGWHLPFSYGFTNRKGEFELKTEAGHLGAVAGKHQVWVVETTSESEQDTEPSGVSDYSKHAIELTANGNDPVWVDIRHDQGLRVNGETEPPSWAQRHPSGAEFDLPRDRIESRSQERRPL